MNLPSFLAVLGGAATLVPAQCGTLNVTGSINPAQTITLSLASAPSYGQAFLFASDTLGATFIDLGPLGSFTLGLSSSFVMLPIGAISATGTLTYSFTVPASTPTASLPSAFSFQVVTATLNPLPPPLLAVCVSNAATVTPASIDTDDAVHHWHEQALAANALSCAPSTMGPLHANGEQAGPHRTSRAFAMTYIAIFESLLAIEGGYQSYVGISPVAGPTSAPAAIAKAAHDVLAALYPSQAWIFDSTVDVDLGLVADGPAKTAGIALGQSVASAVLAMRASDGSNHAEPVVNSGYTCSNQPGFWRPDPIWAPTVALGALWAQVTPFALSSAAQFRAAPPPALTSLHYTVAFFETYALGGDGVTSLHVRTQDQTYAGLFWAYDKAPFIGAPPRLFNQILMHIALQQGATPIEKTRLLALANIAQADAGIACWDSKYFYEFWRPTSAIREADAGTGPTGLGDGNAATIADPVWSPLGAPASNSTNPNFTPPFPAYPSGHATFGAATFQTLRRFYNTDAISFTFVSDELNGVTTDNQGVPRPLVPRTFLNLSQAEEENGQSRMYLGIHWNFDKTAGITMGRAVANWVFDHVYQPIP